LNLIINHYTSELATITLYSMDGRIVKQQKQLLYNGSNLIVLLQLMELKRGAYLLEVKTGTGKKIKKVLKNH